MSENLRMSGIVVVFLGIGLGGWYLFSGWGVDEEVAEAITPELVEREVGVIPEFEFEVIRNGTRVVGASDEDSGIVDLGVGIEDGSIEVGQWLDVSGIVLRQDTGESVQGVRVFSHLEYAVGRGGALTDAKGEFVLDQLGFGEHSIGIEDDVLVMTQEVTVEVAGGRADDEEVVVEVLPGGVIKGRVFNVDSFFGISGVEIVGLPVGIEHGVSRKAVTDARGYYELEGLHAGVYEVGYVDVFGYDMGNRSRDKKRVKVELATTYTGVDFEMSSGLQISGVVVDETGAPISGATVWGAVRRGLSGQLIRTEANGQFVLTDFQPNSRIKVWADLKGYAYEEIQVELTNASVKGVQVLMVPEAKISGTIVDRNGRPKVGARLYASIAGGSFPTFSKVTGEGGFVFEGLLSDTYFLKAFVDMRTSTTDKPLATVTVAAGEHKEGVRVVWGLEESMLESAANLEMSGIVVDDVGMPIENAQLEAWGASKDQRRSSDSNGRFVFQDLMPGSYTVIASHDDYEAAMISQIADTHDGRIAMNRNGTISGQVLSAETGRPLKRFSLFVLPANKTGGDFRSSFRSYSDEEGRFSVKSPGTSAGDPRVMAKANGYGQASVVVSGMTPGGHVEGVVVRLEPEARLSGYVKNAAGEGLPGAKLLLLSMRSTDGAMQQRFEDITDGQGHYRMLGLSHGEMSVTAHSKGYAPQTQTVVLSGTDNELDFVLGVGGSVEGYVYLDGQGVEGAKIFATTPGMNARNMNIHVSTDDSGYYVLKGLPESRLRIRSTYRSGEFRRFKTAKVVSIIFCKSILVNI